MKKNLFLSISLLLATAAFAQIGVNNTNPQATLDVTGNAAVPASLDGIIAPRLTGDQLRSKTYTSLQVGALVYVTLADTAPAGQTINVKSQGYYYYDSTSVWIKIAADTTNDAWVNDPLNTNPQVKLGTKSDGVTARTAGTDFVALDNGNVGIGLAVPTTKLEITSTGTNNPLKLNNLQTGTNTDKLLTVDASGNIRQVNPSGVVGLLIGSGNYYGTTLTTYNSGVAAADIPGATFTVTPLVNCRIIITSSVLPLPAAAGAPVQGSINLLENGNKIASQYYSASDASGLSQLGNYSTISRVLDLNAGTTYIYKMQLKSWYNNTVTNINPVTFPYGGAIATSGGVTGDENSMKALINYLLFTR